ncbi:hypothetical protein LXA43DRAFT_596170 [Ganoderma leucocontextum]|nr:hypothetical protein LXA43DRAFT_596170 [Ganoderma leucocontextum]
MVFSPVRLLLLSLCVTSALARLTSRAPSQAVRNPSPVSGKIDPIEAAKDVAPANAHSGPSPPCAALQTGYIRVASNTTDLNGYLAAQPNKFGEYGLMTNTTENALRSSFCPDEASGNKTFSIYTSNGISGYPCLGGVQGTGATISPSKLDRNSTPIDYVRLAGTQEVPRGPAVVTTDSSVVPPTPRAVESSIWTTDPGYTAPMRLTPAWINPDGSLFLPSLVHFKEGLEGYFLLVGERPLLPVNTSTVGVVSAVPVVFTFVPDSQVSQAL